MAAQSTQVHQLSNIVKRYLYPSNPLSSLSAVHKHCLLDNLEIFYRHLAVEMLIVFLDGYS